MRQANLFMMSAAMLLAACGGTKDAGKTDQVLIEKSDIKIEGKRMTPKVLRESCALGYGTYRRIRRIARRKENCVYGSVLQRTGKQK